MSVLVSVVVPVYNVEDYIGKCIESIQNQTYSNIEIVVVNDGSQDISDRIIKAKQELDSRIMYFKQENAGLSAARNTGIKNSTGDYIVFVDADDWIREDAIEILLNASAEDKSDIVVFNMSYIYSDGTKRQNVPSINKRECIDNITGIKEELIGQKYKFHAPNKMFRRKLFIDGNVLFPVGKLYEDLATTYKLIAKAGRISLVPEELYYYLQKREGSITKSNISEKMFNDLFEAVNGVINFVKSNSWQMEDELQALFAENTISICNYIYKLNKDNKNFYRNRLINEENWFLMNGVIRNPYMPVNRKLRAMLIRKAWPLYCQIMKEIRGNKV